MKKFLTGILVVFLGFQATAQRVISGRITNQKDSKTISGAIITIKGTNQATLSDFNGEFKLDIPDEGGSLLVTANGFVPVEIEVGARSVVDIQLAAITNETKSEITVGFGTQTREQSTGSIASVSNEDLGSQPVINLEQSTQGRATGVFTKNSGGKLGSSNSVRIRGGSSLTGSNEPLYVVDGVPLSSGNQSDINPANIASIEVLKDASAAAMYGSRAANGVILITTKTGQSGKMKIDADYQFGVSASPKRLDLYTPEQYNEQFMEFTLRVLGFDEAITKERLKEWGQTGTANFTLGSTNFNINVPLISQLTYNTDWQEEVFQTAYSHRANVNLSGGNERNQYFAGIGYTNQQGILIGNSYDRINGRLNINSKITSKLSFNAGISYALAIDNKLPDDQDLGSPLQAIVLPPSDQSDPNNDYILRVRSLEYTPLTEINYSNYIDRSNQLVGNAGFTYTISDNLTFQTDLGIDYSHINDSRRQGPQTLSGRPTGLSQLREVNTFNYVFNSYFNYNKSFGDHNLSAVVGGSYQQSQTSILFRSARVNSIAELKSKTSEDADLFNPPVPGTAFAFVSAFSRINYTYQGKYVLQFSGRMDGSSRFGTANRYGFFPALSAGWNISNESFLENNNIVSFLKLKTSYGLVGNTPDEDFIYRTNYFTVFYRNDPGLRLSNLSNPNLRWETTALFDLGLDFGFLNDRISGDVSYYKKMTTDLLFPVPVSQTSGFDFVLQNIGAMENSGIELSLSSINFERDNFSWTTDFNIAFNENKITDLDGRNLISGVNAFLEGSPIGSFYMPVYTGVDPLTGLALYENGTGGTTTNYQSALTQGRRVAGNPNPKYFGGLGNTIAYQNIELSFLFQFVGGVDLYNRTGEFLANSGIQNLGQLASQDDRWYEPGDEAKYPKLNPTQENTFPSTRWLEDGSFIRLNNLTLSYTLPSVITNGWGIDIFKFYIGGQNLFTITDYTGYDADVNYVDPEGGTIGQNISRGIDDFTAPQARTFVTGIKIGF